MADKQGRQLSKKYKQFSSAKKENFYSQMCNVLQLKKKNFFDDCSFAAIQSIQPK